MSKTELKLMLKGCLLSGLLYSFFGQINAEKELEERYEQGYEEGFKFGKTVGKGEVIDLLIKRDSL